MDISDIERSIADAENTAGWTRKGSVNYGLIALTKAVIYLADIVKEIMLKRQ